MMAATTSINLLANVAIANVAIANVAIANVAIANVARHARPNSASYYTVCIKKGNTNSRG